MDGDRRPRKISWKWNLGVTLTEFQLEAEKKCQNATADELAKEKECVSAARGGLK